MIRTFVVLLLLLVVPRVAAAQADNLLLYGANRERQMFAIDLGRESISPVGVLPVQTQAIEQDPVTGYVYYYERLTTADEFGYWNPATGTSTLVRRYTTRPGIYAKRLAFAPNGILYLMDDNDVLWIIDKLTGNLTQLGLVSGLVTGKYKGTGDITFGPDGTMYLNTYEHVYTVDLVSRTATPLHLDVLGPGQIGSGLAYCSGSLYASVLDEPGVTVRLVRIDILTGAVTTVLEGIPVLNDLSTCVPGIPTPPPVQPTGLSAQASGTNRIVLQWLDNSTNETAFRIERRVGSAPFQYVATVGAGTTTFTNTGLTSSVTYTYRVYAFNYGGHSDFSNEASATTSGTAPNLNAPVAQLLTPTDGAVFAVGRSFGYSGSATDVEDGTLPASAFVWDIALQGGAFTRFRTGARSGNLSIPQPGVFVIRLTVRDSGGLSDQRQVTITVQ